MLRITAGLCGIASQMAGLMALLFAVARAPRFSWTDGYLSTLGVEGAATTVFNAGLISTGLLSLVFATGLGQRLLSGRLIRKAGMVSLILGSAGFSAIGMFPRTTGVPHDLASQAFFAFILLAIFLSGIHLVIASQKAWGGLSFVLVSLMVIFQLLPSPWKGGAIPQLLSCLPWSAWTIIFGIRLLTSPGTVNVRIGENSV